MPQAVETLVSKLLGQEDFYPDKEPDERRSIAWAIATQQYQEGNLSANALDQIEFSSIEAPHITLEASEDGEILRFRDAVLAVAEENKNGDTISEANLGELAASLVGRAIDIDHETPFNAGIITEASTQSSKLMIGGLLWKDRYPDEVGGVQAGTHHLSVEGIADAAICSTCGGEFQSASHYCSHLKARRTSGAKRSFKGLRGKGAGITRNPAGSGTTFDRSKIFVVAHTELEANKENLMECPHCGKMSEGENCTHCSKSMKASVIAQELKEALTSLEALRSEQEALGQEKAELTASLQTEQEAHTATKAQLQEKETELKARQDAEREARLKPVMAEEKWSERKEHILALAETDFNILAASLEEVSQKQPNLAGIRNLGRKKTDEANPDKLTISLR